MAINYEEKRDFQRMPVECDITYTIAGSSVKCYGKGSDLSATGVMFSTDQDLAVGTELEVNIHPYIKTVQPLQAKARVIRNDRQNGSYIIGIQMYDVK